MSALPGTTAVPLYAGFWRRAAAYFVDSLVLALPNFIAVFALMLAAPGAAAIAPLVQFLVAGTYFVLLHSSGWQATPGKRLYGIKVTDREGGRISVPHAIGRFFAQILSALPLGIGLLMAGFTGRRQALHDMICGTVVVNHGATAENVAAGGEVMPVTGGVWLVIVLLFILPFFGGVVAAIAIPAYQDYTMRAKVAEVIGAVRPIQERVEQGLLRKEAWPTGVQEIGTAHAEWAQVSGTGEVVVVLGAPLGGGRLVFTPQEAAGVLQWSCRAQGVRPPYLPRSCRG